MMAMPRTTPFISLAELLQGVLGVAPSPDAFAALAVHGLSLDSRRVVPGDVFCACAGGCVHGRQFIAPAIAAGAMAILYECAQSEHGALEWRSVPGGHRVPILGVAALSRQVGILADRFYGHPSAHLFMVGITGTNGKTSVSHFLAHALHAESPQAGTCGLIGTLGNGLVGKLVPATHTTPDAATLHGLLAHMHEQGAQSVVMEVSSHGLDQGRVNGVAFNTAVLTNLTRDHLDYHGDMAAYARAKQRLFTWPGLQHAVINTDDAFGRTVLADLPAGVATLGYGLRAARPGADLQGRIRHQDSRGLCLEVDGRWGRGEIETRLLGRFNASNLLAVIGVLLVRGLSLEAALTRLRDLPPVPGRMACFGGGNHPLVVVDYAHTPDALAQVLDALRAHAAGRVWCVFGCGGERDKGKRAEMGAVAERLADFVILTDDNPRHEDAWTIIADIQTGLCKPDASYVERDRGGAIGRALSLATAGDVVLIAGKGHEDYQLVGDEHRPFSDIEQVRRQVGQWQTRGEA